MVRHRYPGPLYYASGGCLHLSVCPLCNSFINHGEKRVKMYPGNEWVHEECLERKREEEAEMKKEE